MQVVGIEEKPEIGGLTVREFFTSFEENKNYKISFLQTVNRILPGDEAQKLAKKQKHLRQDLWAGDVSAYCRNLRCRKCKIFAAEILFYHFVFSDSSLEDILRRKLQKVSGT